jgi:hypothetical protein
VDMFQYPVPALSPSSSSPTLNLPVKPSDFSPEEIALVLASIEGARYQMIIDSDCIGWLEGIHDSNMISTFITENIKLSYWVQKSILKSSAQSQRSTNFKYFIRIVKVRFPLVFIPFTPSIIFHRLLGMSKTSQLLIRFCALPRPNFDIYHWPQAHMHCGHIQRQDSGRSGETTVPRQGLPDIPESSECV